MEETFDSGRTRSQIAQHDYRFYIRRRVYPTHDGQSHCATSRDRRQLTHPVRGDRALQQLPGRQEVTVPMSSRTR